MIYDYYLPLMVYRSGDSEAGEHHNQEFPATGDKAQQDQWKIGRYNNRITQLNEQIEEHKKGLEELKDKKERSASLKTIELIHTHIRAVKQLRDEVKSPPNKDPSHDNRQTKRA
jgi:predicted RNase H-like nuclease (RuvC/YqgF family)